MARPRSRWRNRLEMLPVRALAASMRALPTPATLAFSRGLAHLAWGRNDRYRREAEASVQRSLGVDAEQARRIVRESYQSISRSFAGFAALNRRIAWDHVEIEGREHLEAARACGRGVLVCSGHFGAWETLPEVLAHHLMPPHLVMRTPRNPLIVDALQRRLGADLAGIVPKYAGGTVARLIRDRQCVLALLDQNAGRRGIVVDFLGRPARQHATAGRLAVRFGALLLPMYVRRGPGPVQCRVVVERPIEPDPDRAPDDAVLDVTRRLSASLEGHVRSDPGQWNWIHDRWHNADHAVRESDRAVQHADPDAQPTDHDPLR